MTTLHITSNLIDLDTRLAWDYSEPDRQIKNVENFILWLNSNNFQPHNNKTEEATNRYTYLPDENIIYVSLYTLLDSSVEDFNALYSIKTHQQFVKLAKKFKHIKR